MQFGTRRRKEVAGGDLSLEMSKAARTASDLADHTDQDAGLASSGVKAED
jgi:hypothetical protein